MEILKLMCPGLLVIDEVAKKAKENPEKADKAKLISLFNPALGVASMFL